MAFQIPAFQPMPTLVVADANNPDCAEVQIYHTQVATWRIAIDRQLGFIAPQYVMPALPTMYPVNTSIPVRTACIREMQHSVTRTFTDYAVEYNNFAQQIAQAVGPQPTNIPLPQVRPQKMKLLAEFTRKDSAMAQHFLKQCNNYMNQQQMQDDKEKVRWALQLMEGEAAQWRDEMLNGFDELVQLLYCTDWDEFQQEYRLCWEDPYEANKATIKLMSGTLNQTTSVKKYNNLFNGYMDLSPYDGTNGMVLDAYKRGLKYDVLNGAMAQCTPNMTFVEIQRLMVQVDETQQQYRTRNKGQGTTAPLTCTVINNPTFNVQTTPTSTATTSSSRATTPVKAEAARQYTKLTPKA